VDTWIEINKGETCEVYGKLYCPTGMSQSAKDWYLTVIAYDYAYSTTQAIATHNMHFQVGSTQPPDVNISSSWWIETALFALVGIACLALVKYGGKWAFK